MRLQQYINEKYFGRVKNRGISFEVFVNPTKKEMDENTSHGELRFTAVDEGKNLYVWDAYKGIHMDVWVLLLQKREKLSVRQHNRELFIGIIEGIAKKRGKKWVMTSCDGLDEFFRRRGDPEGTKNLLGYVPEEIDVAYTKKKFQWLNKYIDINSYFSKFKEDAYYREIL